MPVITTGIAWAWSGVIDGVAQDGTSGAPDARVTVTLAAGALQVRVYECPLTYPLLDPGDATVQLARFYLRGRQCAIRAESVGGIEEGTLIFETPELEVEVLRETTATVSP